MKIYITAILSICLTFNVFSQNGNEELAIDKHKTFIGLGCFSDDGYTYVAIDFGYRYQLLSFMDIGAGLIHYHSLKGNDEFAGTPLYISASIYYPKTKFIPFLQVDLGRFLFNRDDMPSGVFNHLRAQLGYKIVDRFRVSLFATYYVEKERPYGAFSGGKGLELLKGVNCSYEF